MKGSAKDRSYSNSVGQRQISAHCPCTIIYIHTQAKLLHFKQVIAAYIKNDPKHDHGVPSVAFLSSPTLQLVLLETI